MDKSAQRRIGPGQVKHFSTFNDYLQHLITTGLVASRDDLITHHPAMLPKILLNWIQQGQVACVFARYLAARSDEANWRSIVVGDDVDVEVLQDVLDESTNESQAVQIIWPNLTTPEDAVSLLQHLCSTPYWTCERIDWMQGESGKSIQVGLRWYPTSGTHVSWAIGFAPFAPMPFTRRFIDAPFIALALRTASPTTFAPTPNDAAGRVVSHLAHMDDLLRDNPQWREAFNQQTRKAKFALLASDLSSTARAKVTFALPPWCDSHLDGIVS